MCVFRLTIGAIISAFQTAVTAGRTTPAVANSEKGVTITATTDCEATCMNDRPYFSQPIAESAHDNLWRWVQNQYALDDNWQTLWLNGLPLGRLNPQWMKRLQQDWQGAINIGRDGIYLQTDCWLSMGDALQHLAADWQKLGILKGWRNEKFDVFDAENNKLFELERAAFRPFGLQSRAIHVNGLVWSEQQWQFWISRRSPQKVVAPNKLDNLVGGGVSCGESIIEALRRESYEEAGLPPAYFLNSQPNARLHSLRSVSRGLHNEILYIFDVVLPEEVIPENQDGEVAGFYKMTIPQLIATMQTDALMADSQLVTLQALQRYGLLHPQHPLSRWLNKHTIED